MISGKVLADEVIYGAKTENSKKWNINGEEVFVGVERK